MLPKSVPQCASMCIFSQMFRSGGWCTESLKRKHFCMQQPSIKNNTPSCRAQRNTWQHPSSSLTNYSDYYLGSPSHSLLYGDFFYYCFMFCMLCFSLDTHVDHTSLTTRVAQGCHVWGHTDDGMEIHSQVQVLRGKHKHAHTLYLKC